MLAENNKKDFDVAMTLYTKLLTYYPELYRQQISQIADKGYYVEKVFQAFHAYFDGKSFIPKKKQNTDEKKIKIPDCQMGLKMKYKDRWYEEKQKRFRIRFCCPQKGKECKFRKTKNGCNKYFQVREPYPGEIQQLSPAFQKLYPLRQSVERVNSYLQLLGWEKPNCFAMRSIENIIGFALLGKSLKTFL